LRREVRALRASQGKEFGFASIIGDSAAMKAAKALMAKVAASPASTVLLTGETGTGKELVARAIHENSSRRQHLLVKVNCAALSPSLIASELFGHEAGAFTGAGKRRLGYPDPVETAFLRQPYQGIALFALNELPRIRRRRSKGRNAFGLADQPPQPSLLLTDLVEFLR